MMKKKISPQMLNLFNHFLIFNIFAGGFILSVRPFDFYTGYIFIAAFLILYIIVYRKIYINRWFLEILMCLVLGSLLNVYLKNDTIFLMTKQVIGILVTGIAYYLLIVANEFKAEELFKIYLKIALIIAVIGIFQEISYLLRFEYGYDFSWIVNRWKCTRSGCGLLRVNSICMEPSHFAMTMIPAVFVSLASVLNKGKLYLNKISSLLIIISVILSFSSVAYIAILISLILIFTGMRKSRFILLIVVIVPVIAYSLYRYLPEIHERTNHTIDIITGAKPISKAHLSVYALVSNGYVAYKSFADNPLIGHGLGSHPLSYDKIIQPGSSGTIWYSDYPKYPPVNREDAGSLFLRLASETGLLGLFVVFYFLFKFRIRNTENINLHIISKAIFVLFLLQLFRQGHYFYNGLFFFVWIYYFAYKISNKEQLA